MTNQKRQIRKFWKPDGSTADPKNDAVLRAWMSRHGMSMQAGAITTMIHSPVHRSIRSAWTRDTTTPPPARTGRRNK